MSEQAKIVCTECQCACDKENAEEYEIDGAKFWTHDMDKDCIDALRAAHEALLRRTQSLETALDQERAKVRELAESRPMASISLCCKIVRIGRWDEATMHDGGCYERNGRKLGPTYYLHDVSALLSGRGEGEGSG